MEVCSMSVLDENTRIYKYFEDISKIPHGSFHEEKIADYVEDFAKSHSLDFVRDDMNNVIIYKPATTGYEDHDVVMLQAHMDMVCEKNNDVDFDFEKDALQLYVEDGWLKAKGTTLGADDGFGVSYMLSILEDDTLKHPALECVFTVQEEVGLLGSIHLKKEYFKAKKMIGLDGGGEVSTCTTTSGGRYAFVKKECAQEKVNLPTYKLVVKGLDGGHSGGCIDQEKGNSIKILFRVLQTLKDIQIVSVEGGLKENAIPREAQAIFVSSTKPEIHQIVKDIKEEFEFSDANLDIQLEETEKVSKAFTKQDTKELIALYYLLPNGFQHKSMAIEGLTVASLNLGKLRTNGTVVECAFCIRSPLESMKDEMANKIRMIAKLCHASEYENTNFPGWNFQANSPLRDTLQKVLEKQGVEMKTEATHGGMETGILKGLLPDLDIITYGPIAQGCHTPEEKLNLESFKRAYKNLCDLIAEL